MKNPKKITIVLPQNIESDSIKTLINHCEGDELPIIFRHNNSLSYFEPLSEPTLLEINSDAILYFTSCIESFKSIKAKITYDNDYVVHEYSVFPSWKNPRWIIPRQRSLWFGKMSRMIQPSKIVSKIAVYLFRILKAIDKVQYVFNCRIIIAHKNQKNFLNFFNVLGTEVRTGIVYTGSNGPLQKFTVELMKKNNYPFAFAKFGHSDVSRQAVLAEKITLNRLSNLSFSKIKTPISISTTLPKLLDDRTLVVRNLEGGKPLKNFNNLILRSLSELFLETHHFGNHSVKEYSMLLENFLKDLGHFNLDVKYEKMRIDLINVLQHISAHINGSTPIPLAMSHGDFTRWNIMADDKKLYVIDWEEANMRPPGYDLLYFLLSESVLVHHTKRKQEKINLNSEIIDGALTDYIKQISLNKNCPSIDNFLIGILFFTEVICSNLRHISLHSRFGYPQKQSLFDVVDTSYACCLELSRLRNSDIDEGF